jgi:NAD kinase
MEGGRSNISTNFKFKCPLIVYKYSSDKAYNFSFKILDYLFSNQNVSTIYVEDLDKSNVETLLKYKLTDITLRKENKFLYYSDSDESENLIKQGKTKLQKFELGVSHPDICIIIGGDGTTLWTNHLFKNEERPPFLIFNLGTLGYMAIYNCDSYKEVLDELFSESAIISIEKRALINVKIYNAHKKLHTSEPCGCSLLDPHPETEDYILEWEGNALNDIILEKLGGVSIVSLKIYVNNEPLTVVKCDGLIIASSTGSTAYNLSAGGSVIHYDVDAMILNAICPLSLSFRPITFPRNVKLKFVPCFTSYDKVEVNADCIMKRTLQPYQFVEISLSDIDVKFIVLDKFVKNRTNLWKQKIVDQLGWNNSFKNVD